MKRLLLQHKKVNRIALWPHLVAFGKPYQLFECRCLLVAEMPYFLA